MDMYSWPVYAFFCQHLTRTLRKNSQEHLPRAVLIRAPEHRNWDMSTWPSWNHVGWWFGTFLLFHILGNSNPSWQIVFRGVGIPPTTYSTITIINHPIVWEWFTYVYIYQLTMVTSGGWFFIVIYTRMCVGRALARQWLWRGSSRPTTASDLHTAGL